MLKGWRLPLATALFTFLFYGALRLSLFPAPQQFAKYPQAAAHYLAQTLPPERLLDFSPFYLYLHVGQQALFPAADGVILLLQLAAVSCSAALLLLLLQRFVSLSIALLGVVAFVFSPSMMVYSSILEPEAFLVAFLLGLLYFVSLEGWRSRLLAGLFLALALAIRPSVLPLLLLLPLYLRITLGRRRWLIPGALVLTPALFLLLLLGVRNGAATGDYSPLGMNPGFVFFEGNNPLSTGKSAVYPPIVGELKNELGDQPDNPHMTYRLLAERGCGQKLTSTAANRYWRQKALNFIADEPGHFAALLLKKGHFLLHSFARHDLFPAYAFAQRLRGAAIPALPFALLALLALGGMVLARRDWRRLFLLYGLLVSQTAIILLFYVSERQRLALLPAVIVFAAIAGEKLLTLPGQRRIGACLGIAALTLLLSWPGDLMREEEHLWTAYNNSDQAWAEALREREAGRFAAAAQAAVRGYAAAPWLRDYARPEVLPFARPDFVGEALATLRGGKETPSQRFDRAQLLLAAGKLSEAKVLLQSLQGEGVRFDRVYLQSSQPDYYLAEIAWREGDGERAIALLNAGLTAAPGDPFILARLGALTGREEYRQQIVRYYGEIDASFLLGMAEQQVGKGREAVLDLAATSRLLPELRRARIYQAAALGAAGKQAQGAQLYLEATATARDPVLLEGEIVPIFAALAADGDPPALYRYGLILAQYGRLDEARRALQRAAEISAQPEIARALAEVEAITRAASR